MKIAIIGGGISGLSAAYELELARKRGADIDWHLYEASDRLGGIIETTRIDTPEGRFILEGGPDGWVTEKPWARDLAIELGLESDLIYSNDATRRTYILVNGTLQPIPDRMSLMVPEDLSTLEGSPLFTASAKQAYADELRRADELRATAPGHDESVATFTRRHFGDEVLRTLAAPLLSGVFGGNVERLSVRAVMPAFVAMERQHGSLIAALQSKAHTPRPPIFTTLRHGMSSLIDALAAALPASRIHLNTRAEHIWDDPCWQLILDDPTFEPDQTPHPCVVDTFEHIIFATPLHATTPFLAATDYDRRIDRLLPTEASSSILATFTWPESQAKTFAIPPGFGFLVPSANLSSRPESAYFADVAERPAAPTANATTDPQLLACTFVDQKFPHRAPPGARILRAFFGGASADALSSASNEAVAHAALTQLRHILGPIPDPTHTEVRRWPHSLPQYEVGHLERIAQLGEIVSTIPGLTLLGNAYRGVGLPDLIRDARAAARALTS